MKIVFYACVRNSLNGPFQRARITVVVGDDELSPHGFNEYFTEAVTDFLPGSCEHDSCNHAPTFSNPLIELCEEFFQREMDLVVKH
jgi:hypothetical protein